MMVDLGMQTSNVPVPKHASSSLSFDVRYVDVCPELLRHVSMESVFSKNTFLSLHLSHMLSGQESIDEDSSASSMSSQADEHKCCSESEETEGESSPGSSVVDQSVHGTSPSSSQSEQNSLEAMIMKVLTAPTHEIQNSSLGLSSPPPPSFSIGSTHHGQKPVKCKPCRFYFRQGCEHGTMCKFCHLCTLEESKQIQKDKKTSKKKLLARMDLEGLKQM